MKLFLSKEEKQQAELISVKRGNLLLQDQLLQKEMDGLVAQFCNRNSIDVSKAETINPEQGFIEFKDEKEPREKTKNSKKK